MREDSPGVDKQIFQIQLSNNYSGQEIDYSYEDPFFNRYEVISAVKAEYRIRKIKGHRRLVFIGYSHTVEKI